MIKSYFKIALRNLWKNRGYTAINITGLTLAFCIGSFLVLTAYFQLTYDNFHQNSKHIFQTYFVSNEAGVLKSSGETPLPLAPAMKTEMDDISHITRVNTGRKTALTANDKSIECLLAYTDADFLTMFSFPLVNGFSKTALGDFQNLVISQSTALALFGTENPIGKIIKVGKIGSETPFIVSAVAKDCPANSSINFEALARIETMPDYQKNKASWNDNGSSLYVMLSDKTSSAQVEKKLEAFSKKYFPSKTENPKNTFAIKLQALSKVHFDKNVSSSKAAPIAIVYALMGLAAFILLIACFNFVNLSIAKHLKRASEMGVRKTLGALKHHIFIQLWGEAVVICLLAFSLGFVLVVYLLPSFNAYFNAKIDLAYLFQPQFLAIIFSVLILVTLLAGGYPAYKMTGLNLVEVLKGKTSKNKPSVLRSTLLVSQFAISTLLICITVIANKQLEYLQEKPLGFDKEQVISIPIGNQLSGRKVFELIKNEFENDASIVSISAGNTNLGKGKDRVTTRSTVQFDYKTHKITADWIVVDGDFLGTMNIPLIEGNQQIKSTANEAVWVSENIKNVMGNGEVLNTFLNDSSNLIAGVFKDFNLYSPSQEANPVVIQQSKDADIQYIFLKVRPPALAGSMEKIKEFWKKNTNGLAFMGSFLNENIESWYQNERMLTQIFSLASGIAIALSCMGLFAISLLIIELRTKEIGIRKILGASTQSIVWMICSYFLKFIFIAFVIALPLAWLAMNSWLQDYSYRIPLNFNPFILVILSISSIALLTVSFQAIKAAIANPVKSLRTE